MTSDTRPQLFLDCDGVLADFDAAFTAQFGHPPRVYEEQKGSSTFWRDIQHEAKDFYRNLPLMADARALYDAVAHLRPIILTGCPLGGWAQPQKLAWAAEHFPGVPMITCMSKDKRTYCRPGDILIDDYLKYRDLWEGAGGTFIHHTSAETSLAALTALVTPPKVGSGELDAAGLRAATAAFIENDIHSSAPLNAMRAAIRAYLALSAPVDHPEVVGAPDFVPCDGCDGYVCVTSCAYPGAALQPSDSPALEAGVATEAKIKDATTEYLSHRGERPYRVLRGGQELWEVHMPAMRAAFRAAALSIPATEDGK